MFLPLYIDRLEQFSVCCGARVFRNSLAGGVLGRLEERRIVLRTGLSLEQQVLTLAHELTHLIAHCKASPRLNRTVCEYEAEAVERWVGAELKVAPYDEEGIDVSTCTDDLLAGSVLRVRWAARTIVMAARDGAPAALRQDRLQA
jgi:hypothetical protein